MTLHHRVGITCPVVILLIWPTAAWADRDRSVHVKHNEQQQQWSLLRPHVDANQPKHSVRLLPVTHFLFSFISPQLKKKLLLFSVSAVCFSAWLILVLCAVERHCSFMNTRWSSFWLPHTPSFCCSTCLPAFSWTRTRRYGNECERLGMNVHLFHPTLWKSTLKRGKRKFNLQYRTGRTQSETAAATAVNTTRYKQEVNLHI